MVCIVLSWLYNKLLMDWCDLFTHILQSWLIGTAPITILHFAYSNDVMSWKRILFEREIHRSPVNSRHTQG